MRERILWVGPEWASPASDELIGAVRSALDELRASFEVETFIWPCIKGGHDLVPTWQGAVQAMRGALTPRCHVVATGFGPWVALLAMGQSNQLTGSLIVTDAGIPDATLRAMGASSLAEASTLSHHTGESIRRLTRGLNRVAAEQVRSDLDLLRYKELVLSIESVNLLEQKLHVTVPCLSIEGSQSAFHQDEVSELLRRLASNMTTRRLERWVPDDLDDHGAGREFAVAVTEFIRSLSRSSRFLTVLFTDIVDSTVRAVELGDESWSRLLSTHHEVVRSCLARYGGSEVDTAGDSFLATFESPARAVRCALCVRDNVKELALETRSGLHAGECEMVGDKPAGATLHAAARIAAAARAGEVLLSKTVRDLVSGSEVGVEDCRKQSLKGFPGEWELFPLSSH